MWTIKPPPLLRLLGIVLLVSRLTWGQQSHRPPPQPPGPPRLIPFNNHGGHNFNVQEDSSSSEEDSDSESDSTGQPDPDHYPQSYPNIGYRAKVPIGASHSPHQFSDPFTRPPTHGPIQNLHGQHQQQYRAQQQMTETTPATLEEIEASYEDSLLRLNNQGKLPFNPKEFSSPHFFDQIMDHHHYDIPPPQLGQSLGNHHHQPQFPPVGAPIKAPFKPSAPFSPNFESTSGFKPSFGPPVKGPLGIPTFTLGTSGLRPGHVSEAPNHHHQHHGPLSATYIPSSRPNLYKDLEITYPPNVVGGPGYSFDSSQLPDESKKTTHSISVQPSHNPPVSSTKHSSVSPSPVKEEYKVIFVNSPPTTTHSPYRAAPPIVLKQSRGPLSNKPSESITNSKKLVAQPSQVRYPTQDVSSSQDSPLRPDEQAILYHLFSKTDGQSTTTRTTTTVATPPSTSTTTSVYLAQELQSSPITLSDYSFGDILKLPPSPLKPKKKKKNKDKATAYSISHPYIIPLKSPKIGSNSNFYEPEFAHGKRFARKNRLIPVDEDSGFMLTYAPTFSPVSSASTTIPTFVDYAQHGNEVEELLKAYGVRPKDKTKEGQAGNSLGSTSIEDPPTFYTSTTTTTTSAPSTSPSSTTTPFPFKRIKAKPPTEPTTSTTTTTEFPTVRTRGTTTEASDRHSSEKFDSRKILNKNNHVSEQKEKEDEENLSDEYEEEESRYAPKEKGESSSVSSLPESDEDYEGGEEAESSEEYSDEEEEKEQSVPVKSTTKNKKQTSKESYDRPKTLDERKRKNVQDDSSSEEDGEKEVERKIKSPGKASTDKSKEPASLPMFYEPTRVPKRREKLSESSETTTSEPPKEVQRQSKNNAASTNHERSKSKRKKSKQDSSDEEEEEEEKSESKISKPTTHQPRIGKKNSIDIILDSVRNSTLSSDVNEQDLRKEKSSKRKRQRIKPSVAKRLQKSGSKKIRKVRRKNKRKKTRAS